MGKEKYYYHSPIGILCLEEVDGAITAVHCMPPAGERERERILLQKWNQSCRETQLLCEANCQLQEYFRGKRKEFDLPIHMQGTGFQKKVWEALCQIPYGETRSYRDVAEMVGNPKAFRAVGGANNRNPIMILVPCHRVIGANGALVGYGGGLPAKEYLLGLEQRVIGKLQI